jgi:hypothetical protein
MRKGVKAIVAIALLVSAFQVGRLYEIKYVRTQKIAADVFAACTDSARMNTPLHDGVPLNRDIENCTAAMRAADSGKTF